MRFTDPISDFFTNIDAITAAGIELPQDFTELRDRLRSFTALDTPCRDRLRDELINPSKDTDLELLRAAALIETEAKAHKLNGNVRHWIVERLREINSAVAAENYGRLAQRFDKLAADFTAATRTVDVEADAATLISAPERQRKTWIEAELLAQALTDAVPGLRAAALLAGITDVRGSDVLALIADPGDELTGRQVWTAWYASGRCGQWAALVAAGITLRAAKLDQYRRYERAEDDDGAKPQPIQPDGGMVAV